MKRWMQGALAVLLALAVLAIPTAQAATLQRVHARFGCTAGESITLGQVVMLKSDGYCYKADADAATLRPAIGVAGYSVSSGAVVEVVTAGLVGGETGLTVGGTMYLSTTAGGTTQTRPAAYPQVVGQAISATQWTIGIQPPPKLGHLSVFPVQDLGAGADIGDGTAANASTLWTPPFDLTITAVKLYGVAAGAGIDDSNTVAIKVYNGTATVVSGTWGTTPAWPAAHVPTSAGTVGNASVSAGTAIKFDVVNGTTANPPAFNLLLEYTVP